jgi:hypothetical protein
MFPIIFYGQQNFTDHLLACDGDGLVDYHNRKQTTEQSKFLRLLRGRVEGILEEMGGGLSKSRMVPMLQITQAGSIFGELRGLLVLLPDMPVAWERDGIDEFASKLGEQWERAGGGTVKSMETLLGSEKGAETQGKIDALISAGQMAKQKVVHGDISYLPSELPNTCGNVFVLIGSALENYALDNETGPAVKSSGSFRI